MPKLKIVRVHHVKGEACQNTAIVTKYRVRDITNVALFRDVSES